MAVTNYTFFNWVSTGTYQRYDVIYGASASDTRYFYSTVNHTGANPNSFFRYPIAGATPASMLRQGNVTRLTFTHTGTANFNAGSIAIVQGIPITPNINFTGTVLAAGSGYIDYLNPGPDQTAVFTAAGTVIAPIHPSWTTGFYWVPSFSTDVTHNQNVVGTQLGESYSQRFSPVINSNSLSWNLVFDERTDKEVMALSTFLENMGGSAPFKINFPIGTLFNTPNLQYIAGPLQNGLPSFNLNNVNFTATQVFDI